jgi:hypothetical protein
MTKLLFLPVSLGTGILAGIISKKVFEVLWRAIDDEAPPQPEHRQTTLGKLALALTIEGALFRLVKGLVDHASRHGFARLTGAWPGEQEPETD